MSNKGGPPEQDDSMWRDLARMEAEVVDPEEAQTSHFDYNQVRAQIEAMNPGALAAADAMFGDDDDSNDDDEMATEALGQRSPLADGIPGLEPGVGPGAGRRPGPRPGAGARPAPAPRPVPLHQPAPGADLSSLLDDHDEVPTRMVDGSRMAELVAKADAERVTAQAGAAPAGGLGALTQDEDDDDDFYDEPTMIAPSAIDALLAQHDVIVNKPKAAAARPAPAIPEPAPSRPEVASIPEPAPSRPEVASLPEPIASRPEPVAQAAPQAAPQAALQAAPQAAPPVPAPRVSEVDLVHLMNEQKKKDTIMWVIAVVLFAVGVAVLVMKIL